MLKNLNIISVASGIVLIALQFFFSKGVSQAQNAIEVQLNNKLVQTQKYSVSNHKYIFNSFLETLPILMKVQKDEFETTDKYNERFQQTYTFFISQLKSKGINIDNAYSVKINSYDVSYDADKEIVTIKIEPNSWGKYRKFSVLGIESTSTNEISKLRDGIIEHTSTNEYNLATENINKLSGEILSFSLGRNEAKKLISNNILGVAIVCKFIPPFVDEESDYRGFSPKDYFPGRFLSELLNDRTDKYISHSTAKKYIIANAQKIVIYNIKNGKIYSESSISDTPSTDNKTLFDTLQIAEARAYLNKHWQPPTGLSQSLEYSLTLGIDGKIERILPLNQVARKYIDISGIPEIGKPFVSSNKAGQNLRIRVILSPDSKVRLFKESP